MTKSKKSRRSNFPLALHATGQWYKKIRGRFYYFGREKQAAHEEYLRLATDLHEGRPLAQHCDADDTTMKDLANHYLAYQEDRVKGSEISAAHFKDCQDAMKRFVKVVGKHTRLNELTTDRLLRFRSHLVQKYAPTSANRFLGNVKAMFNHAVDVELIDRTPPLRKALAKVSVKQIRHHRAMKIREHGDRMFAVEEVRTLLRHAKGQMNTMILLGVNGGFGNQDCSDLCETDINFEKSMIDFIRGKTGIRRTVPLWPETIEAIQASLRKRPAAHSLEHKKRVFLTPRGHPWVRVRHHTSEKGVLKVVKHDELNKQFDFFLEGLNLKRSGRSFYALRHTHATLADAAKDLHAQKRIMGHAIPGMLGEYIEDIEFDRLRRVAEVVRSAIFTNSNQVK